MLKEVGGYSLRMLLLNTDDEVLYCYKRKLQRHIQWIMLGQQILPILSGLAVYGLTRRLKTKSGSDFFYALIPYCYVNYGIFMIQQRKLYELGYPAHPFI